MATMTQFTKNCSLCNTQFENDISLNIHNFRMHGVLIPVFKCKICSKIFPRKTALQDHKLKSHNQIQDHSNDTIGQASRTLHNDTEAKSNFLSNESKEVINQECKLCSKIFNTKNLLKEHFESAHKNYLRAHRKVKEKYKKNVSFKCDICDEMFSKSKDLKNHMAKSHLQHAKSNRKVSKECEICGKKLKNLESHMMQHEGKENHYKCAFCEKEFDFKCSLHKHIKNIHEKRRLKTNSNVSVDTIYECEMCGKKLSSKDKYKKHVEYHYGNKVTCGYCPDNKMFSGIYNLKRHIKNIHNRKNRLTCHYCSNTFVNQGSLSRHISDVHENKRKYKCDICHKAFKRHNRFREHKIQIHDLEKNLYDCKICGKSFNQDASLYTHNKNVHAGIKRYKCDICIKTFTSKPYLEDHINHVHMEFKNYKCSQCEKYFHTKRNHASHVRTVHNKKSQIPLNLQSIEDVEPIDEPPEVHELNQSSSNEVIPLAQNENTDSVSVMADTEDTSENVSNFNDITSTTVPEIEPDPLKIEPIKFESEFSEIDPLSITLETTKFKSET